MLLSLGGTMFSVVFLGTVWSMESSPASSVWATGRRAFGRSAGWVTDFLLLSTKEKQMNGGEVVDVFAHVLPHSFTPSADLEIILSY